MAQGLAALAALPGASANLSTNMMAHSCLSFQFQGFDALLGTAPHTQSAQTHMKARHGENVDSTVQR